MAVYFVEIAVNRCFGGWKLSYNAIQWLKSRGMKEANFANWIKYQDRHNRTLIECIKTLGKDASYHSVSCGEISCIEIVTLYNENRYFIQDWDGMERVYTINSCPWITAPWV